MITFLKLLFSHLFIWCTGGGGGGGDGGAAEREAQRQARIDAATLAVNKLFGIGDKTQQTPTGEKRLSGYSLSSAPANAPAVSFDTSGNPVRMSVDEYNALANPVPVNTFGKTVYANAANPKNINLSKYSPIYDDVYTTTESDASKAAKAREALYSTVASDTKNFFNAQLEEDKEDARRQLEFHKARTGLFGSSQGIDLGNKFQQNYDRGLLDIANRADSAASGMKSSDEQARLGLLGKITSGIDQGSAVSSALSQLQTNAENSKNQAMTGRMANVFADLVAGLNTGQYNAGAAAAKQQYGGNLGNYYPSATTGASGTVRPQ